MCSFRGNYECWVDKLLMLHCNGSDGCMTVCVCKMRQTAVCVFAQGCEETQLLVSGPHRGSYCHGDHTGALTDSLALKAEKVVNFSLETTIIPQPKQKHCEEEEILLNIPMC